ncbi:hypothetical protein [Teredinibacter franksiae]|uniref:hypothetical protein n=1 Tax=Teredinibacter franksiae TaxID=2761453 RepID=UPI001626B7E5|nr:hypothetical protein [Teredinibacter franksiae]
MIVKVKCKAALWHFIFTAFVAIISAGIIFVAWFPAPFTGIAGGLELWKILIVVELSLGPLMSLVIYNPSKGVRELILDYSLVAVVQLAALIYGLATVYQARPVFFVFVKDRFELVLASEFDKGDRQQANAWERHWYGVSLVSTRPPQNSEERAELLFGVVESGRGVHLRPKYYSVIDVDLVREHGQSLTALRNLLIQADESSLLTGIRNFDDEHYWLPAVNGKSYLIVIMDGSNKPVTFLPIDPWELMKSA